MSVKYFSLGGLILDDVVFPDGQTAMSILGGSGAYAVAGMRLWSSQVGLFARVGPDFGLDLLSPLDLAVNAVQINALPTPRAWQLYEEDGTRTQVSRISDDDWWAQLTPTPNDLPPLAGVQGVHMPLRGRDVEPEVVTTLTEAGVKLCLEPIVHEKTSDWQRKIILDCLRYAEIFSPGVTDAHLLLGERPVAELMTMFAKLGPRLVALRQGADGSLVYERDSGRYWQVPAAQANVVDVTGGGNAYCGGFLVGWLEHADVKQAAARAAVGAAITIEQIGPPTISSERLHDASERLAGSLAEIYEVTEQMI